jgi:hypothetical protein
MSEDARIVGQREFTDRATRPVFQDDKGRFVLDDNGMPIRGIWILPDEPIFWPWE